MNSENSMRPSCRATERGERKRVKRNGPETRWGSHFTLAVAVLSQTLSCSFHDVLAGFFWKWGQTFAPSQMLFFASHLALSWGRNMSPLVISKKNATGSKSKNYSRQTYDHNIRGAKTPRIFQSFHITNGREWSFCPTGQEPFHSEI